MTRISIPRMPCACTTHLARLYDIGAELAHIFRWPFDKTTRHLSCAHITIYDISVTLRPCYDADRKNIQHRALWLKRSLLASIANATQAISCKSSDPAMVYLEFRKRRQPSLRKLKCHSTLMYIPQQNFWITMN